MSPSVQSDWDSYWVASKRTQSATPLSKLYALIAEIYRRILIRPLLNHYYQRYLKNSPRILHAGCGSGQVDSDISCNRRITGLDISSVALHIYKEENSANAGTIQSDLFFLPFKNNSWDGLYNLGVMEHFSQEQIAALLQEFRRCLKKEAPAVIFWPPHYGLSVIFLRYVQKLFKLFSGKTIALHPAEPSLIRSRQQVEKLFEQAGFIDIRYHFSIRDLFTYCIISARTPA